MMAKTTAKFNQQLKYLSRGQDTVNERCPHVQEIQDKNYIYDAL